MNLEWTPKSGNKGTVKLITPTVASILIAKGLAVDLDNIEVAKEPEAIKPKVTINKGKPTKKKKK